MPAAQVYAGLGSNLEPERNLPLAVQELRRRFGRLTVSPVYRNAAVGFAGPDFLNLVVAFESRLAPAALVREFNEIHALAGRTQSEERFVSRSIDIDLLLYGNVVSSAPPLPRDDVLRYAFALKPLCDIAPNRPHPLTGRALSDHWQEMRLEPQALVPVELDLGDGDVAK